MKRIREGGRPPLSDDGAGSDLVSRGERNRYFIGFGIKKKTKFGGKRVAVFLFSFSTVTYCLSCYGDNFM